MLIAIGIQIVCASYQQNIDNEAQNISRDLGRTDQLAHLFQEYCKNELLNSGVCEKANSFMHSRWSSSKPPLLSISEAKSMYLLYFSFLQQLQGERDQLRILPTYPSFFEKDGIYKSSVKRLERENQNERAKHSRWQEQLFHIFEGQSFFAAVISLIGFWYFAPYLEMRMGLATFYILFFSAGLVPSLILPKGMVISSMGPGGLDLPVAAVFGAIWVTFRNKKIKFLFFNFLGFKKASVNVFWSAPLFALFYYGLAKSFDSVFFGTHIDWIEYPIGFLYGAVFAFLYKRVDPVPSAFMYEFEFRRWLKVKKKKSPSHKMTKVANAILSFNPGNDKVKYDTVKKIFEEYSNKILNLKVEDAFLNSHLSHLISKLISTGNAPAAAVLLQKLPMDVAFSLIYPKLKGEDLFHLGQLSTKSKKTPEALIFLCASIEGAPERVYSEEALKLIDEMVSSESLNDKGFDLIQKIDDVCKEPALKNLFKLHIQFSKTALIKPEAG